MNAKLAAFFTEMIHELERSYKSTLQIKSKGFSVETYKGDLEFWPGITFEIRSQGYKIDGWVGCECSFQGPILYIYLWKNKEKTERFGPDALKLEKVLVAQNFEWDKYTQCRYKQLATVLIGSGAERYLVQNLAKETAEILTQVISDLDNPRVRTKRLAERHHRD